MLSYNFIQVKKKKKKELYLGVKNLVAIIWYHLISFDILEVDSCGSMTSEWKRPSEKHINLLFIFNFLFDKIFLKV